MLCIITYVLHDHPLYQNMNISSFKYCLIKCLNQGKTQGYHAFLVIYMITSHSIILIILYLINIMSLFLSNSLDSLNAINWKGGIFTAWLQCIDSQLSCNAQIHNSITMHRLLLYEPLSLVALHRLLLHSCITIQHNLDEFCILDQVHNNEDCLCKIQDRSQLVSFEQYKFQKHLIKQRQLIF